jgi:hypothetical protein
MTNDDWQWEYATISAFKPLEDDSGWDECPVCKRKPRTWVFNNGSYAKCLCGDKYTGAQVSATDVMTWYREHNGDFREYDHDELRKNWNKHCQASMEALS